MRTITLIEELRIDTAGRCEGECQNCDSGLKARAADALESTVDALRGMVGLLTLISARDDVTDDLRLAITTNHRVKAAAEALALAGDFQPDADLSETA